MAGVFEWPWLVEGIKFSRLRDRNANQQQGRQSQQSQQGARAPCVLEVVPLSLESFGGA